MLTFFFPTESYNWLFLAITQGQSPRRGACALWGAGGAHLLNLDGAVLTLPADSVRCRYNLLRDSTTFSVDVDPGCEDFGAAACAIRRIYIRAEDEEFVVRAEGGRAVVSSGSGGKVAVPGAASGLVFEVVGRWLFVHADGLGFHLKWNMQARTLFPK